MLRNYLKIALRHLWRNPLYSLLNIGGLGVGLAVSLMILLFVVHETTYDEFHTNADRIVRVYGKLTFGEQTIQTPAMSAQFGPAVKRANPDVLDYVRTTGSSMGQVVIKTSPERKNYETKFIFADPSLLTVFSFPLAQNRYPGANPKTALTRPMTVLLTERTAERYFGRDNPIGKTITYDNKLLFEVTGVLANPPSNSTIDFDFVASLSSHPVVERARNSFVKDDELSYYNPRVQMGAFLTYFLLSKPDAITRLAQTVPALVKASGGQNQTGKEEYIFDSFRGIHLGGVNFGDTTNSRYVPVFLGVALIILLLALINYMSLTTARASQRAREVGVRKVMGAVRRELAIQFYGESVLTTVLAFGLALVLVVSLRPVFYHLLQLTIDDTFLYSARFLQTIVGLLVVCVLLSGSYPALLLSAFKPVSVLKGRLGATGSGWVRQGFTVFQFAASACLLVCTLVIGQQLSYLRNQNLGLRKDRVLVMSVEARNYHAVKQQIRQVAGVEQVAASSMPLYKEGFGGMVFTESPTTKKQLGLNYLSVDENFLLMLGINWQIKPAANTDLTQPNRILLNEVAVRELAIAGQPIGQKLPLGGTDKSEVVGVVNDFHFASLHQKIQPLALWVGKDTTRAMAYLLVRLSAGADLRQSVNAVVRTYQSFRPEEPITYYFLDEAFGALYKSEDRMATMFGAFTAFAVFIACLGLFGLAAFTAEQRTKEIGVRKVLGASIASIVALLSKDFLKLVLIAIVVASPIAWYAMNRWLQDFAYKITIEWWVFALAGLLAVSIALLTVSFQSIKAALMNPVKSLRSD